MTDVQTDESLRRLIPWRSGVFHVIIASSLMGVMGVSLISPVLPALRPAFGISDAQAGLILTAFTLPGIFATPLIGLAADILGRKRVLIALLLLFGLSGSAIAFTPQFEIVLALRFFQGIGGSGLVMLAITLIGDIYEGAQRDALVGINGSLLGIGAAFYPLIGGTLAVLAWNAPFLFYGVGVLVGFLTIAVMHEPTGDSSTDVRTYFARMAAILRMPRALASFAALFVVVFVFYGAVITVLPLLLSDEFGLTSDLIGLTLAVSSAMTAVTSSQYGRIAGFRSGPELVAVGLVSFGSSLLVIWLAPSVYVIAVAMLGFGVGSGLIFPAIDSTLITFVSEDFRAGMMGLRTSLLRLAQTIAPVGYTFSAQAFFPTTLQGYRVLIVVSGVVVVAGGAISYLALRNRPHTRF